MVDPAVSFKPVRASRGKMVRAEPTSVLIWARSGTIATECLF